MAERIKRRRLADAPAPPSTISQGYLAPATIDDKRNWKGFCEVESEPVCVHPTAISLLSM